MYKQRIVSRTALFCCRMLYWLKNLMVLHWWLLYFYLLCNMACSICCSSAAFVGKMFLTGQHFFVNRNLQHSFMLAKPGSDPRYRRKNKHYTHALFENASASIGPGARHSHLVCRKAELLDHPEHEALIISSSPPLNTAHIVLQLALFNLHLCLGSSHCLVYAPITGLNQVLFWRLRKCVKYSLLIEGIERS